MARTIPDDALLIRFGNAAALLNSPLGTVRYWVRSGLLRPLKVGRSVYFERVELERFISEHRTPKESTEAKQ